MIDVKPHHDQEIDSIFKVARMKLDTIDQEEKDQHDGIKEQTSKKKKDVVVDLAKDLEGKIPIDTISSTIVNRLDGLVSERFIHECLDEKYKQKHKVKNAKKQKKKQVENNNLAAVTPLKQTEEELEDQKEEKQESKEIVVVGADGRAYVQRENDNEPTITSENLPALKGKSFSQSIYQSQKEREQPLETPSQFEISSEDKMESKEMGTSSESLSDSSRDILPFEFRLSRRYVRDSLDSVKPNTDDDDVCFNGTIDLQTGEVISAIIGRHINSRSSSNKDSSRSSNHLFS